LAKKQQEEEKKLQTRIALEERKILIAQRKLESMRLLEELFNRVKVSRIIKTKMNNIILTFLI
jgi:splicing factor, arginine/serine-rich 17